MRLSKTLLLAALSVPLAHATPAPAPLPTPLYKRSCNRDNCYRALGNPTATASASAYCHTYTTTTNSATTGFPTYVPTSCGPARISSACSCLYPAPCPTGQIVHNPSFYGNPPGSYALAPWAISHVSGSGGCAPSIGYSTSDMDGYWGDAAAIECNFGSGGGQDTVSQTVTMCPGLSYTFSAATACDYWTYPDLLTGVSFQVLFNGVVIIDSTPACPACPDCDYPEYTTHTATVISPASGSAALKFVVTQEAASSPVVPMLLDQVFLLSAGYTGPPTDPDVTD